MKISNKLVGGGLVVSAMIVAIAALGFSTLDFPILPTTKDLASPTGLLHEIALFELDPDDDKLIMSSIVASLPVALMMALWTSRARTAPPCAAGEIAIG